MKRYTKKQIMEAIDFWKKELEDLGVDDDTFSIKQVDYNKIITWGEFKKIVDKKLKDSHTFSMAFMLRGKQLNRLEGACAAGVLPDDTIWVDFGDD